MPTRDTAQSKGGGGRGAKSHLDRIEDLREQASLLRNEISRLVTRGDREGNRAKLTELRSRYFRVLDDIDRLKRHPSYLEMLLGDGRSSGDASALPPLPRIPNRLLN